MLTGRPQVQPEFAAWQPTVIAPGGEHNMRDMLELLRGRLKESAFVNDIDLEEAAALMAAKSQVCTSSDTFLG